MASHNPLKKQSEEIVSSLSRRSEQTADQTFVTGPSDRLQASIMQGNSRLITPDIILQLQRSVGNAAVQKLLSRKSSHLSISNSNHPADMQPKIEIDSAATESIQRSPAGWALSADITRMLGHAHGYFSTWKKIKEIMAEYRQLQANQYHDRRTCLEKLTKLIPQWEADSKHTAASTEQRVIDIRADMPQLKQMIETENQELDQLAEDDYYLGQVLYPDVGNPVIPEELHSGIGFFTSNATKAQRIFNNLNNYRFNYTGGYRAAAAGFETHRGDCQTLRDMYILAAQAKGLQVTPRNRPERQLVVSQPIHGRNTQFNTDAAGLQYWYFQEHFWVEVGGVQFDLLFMQSPPPNYIANVGNPQYRGITYYTFAGGLAVIEPTDQLPAIQPMGRVFNTAQLAENYIDGVLDG